MYIHLNFILFYFILFCFVLFNRYGMSGVVYNREMYVFGGYDMNSEPCNDCYKFNPGMREEKRREEWRREEKRGEQGKGGEGRDE